MVAAHMLMEKASKSPMELPSQDLPFFILISLIFFSMTTKVNDNSFPNLNFSLTIKLASSPQTALCRRLKGKCGPHALYLSHEIV